jgi:N-terminal domain of anti-restriction factor ArdC
MNVVSRKEYHGINVMLLWREEWRSPYWVTFRQAKELGGNLMNMELDLFTHPECWPHTELLPVVRRGGDPIYCSLDAGIVMGNNLCRVWTDVYLIEPNPEEGIPDQIEISFVRPSIKCVRPGKTTVA